MINGFVVLTIASVGTVVDIVVYIRTVKSKREETTHSEEGSKVEKSQSGDDQVAEGSQDLPNVEIGLNAEIDPNVANKQELLDPKDLKLDRTCPTARKLSSDSTGSDSKIKNGHSNTSLEHDSSEGNPLPNKAKSVPHQSSKNEHLNLFPPQSQINMESSTKKASAVVPKASGDTLHNEPCISISCLSRDSISNSSESSG